MQHLAIIFHYQKQVSKIVRAFLNAQNLFVITKYSGVDPEVSYSDGGNVLAPGVDRRETWVRTSL